MTDNWGLRMKPSKFKNLICSKAYKATELLRPITWLLSFPAVWAHRIKITKVRIKGIKPPIYYYATIIPLLILK